MAEADRTDAYAAALFAVANAEGELDDGGRRAVRRSPGPSRATTSCATPSAIPTCPADRRQQIVEDLLGGRASDVTIGLVSMVVAAGRGRDLPDIVDALAASCPPRRRVEVAEVRSAVELTEDQRERLAAALTAPPASEVDVRVVVDPTVVGGLVARVGDTGHRRLGPPPPRPAPRIPVRPLLRPRATRGRRQPWLS